MTTAVIVQARMGSARLPGKVMMDLAGKPVLAYVLDRCDRIPGIDVVVCAIPDTAENDCLVPVIEGCGATLFRGSERDVLARYVGAAAAVNADVVVRVTADCPLIDPEICGDVIELRKAKNADYASNVHPRTYPQGLDCEVFTFEALQHWERVSREGREHVTTTLAEAKPVIMANLESERYHRSRYLSDQRWTLDYPEDLEFLRAVFAIRVPRRMGDVFDILSEHPEIERINECRKAA
jgi:spore coat polysaccharide biosynthesis protein SpsF (cytidylyltransferase family)